jgi:hypothetical protein
MSEWVEEILQDQYDWTLDKVDDPDSFFSELGVAYRTWREQVRPHLNDPLIIEEEMFLYLGEGNTSNIWLKGTPDVVFADRIHDHKTTGRAWKEGKAQHAVQAGLYMALVKQNSNIAPQEFMFDVYDRKNSVWDSWPVTRTEQEINASLQQAYQYGLQLEAGIFPATPTAEEYGKVKRGWYCSPKYCGAWNICTDKYINDDKDENVLAIRSWR